jgi:hypothetical protein
MMSIYNIYYNILNYNNNNNNVVVLLTIGQLHVTNKVTSIGQSKFTNTINTLHIHCYNNC